jgi:hypothetical protein
MKGLDMLQGMFWAAVKAFTWIGWEEPEDSQYPNWDFNQTPPKSEALPLEPDEIKIESEQIHCL